MNSFQTLYHISDDEKSTVSVVQDTETGQKYLRKELTVYSVPVFEFLKEHQDPHVPAVYQFSEQDEKLTVIEELVPGETLEVLLAREKLPKRERMRILLAVCDALLFLHAAKPPIIHRDVKPSNIMVDTRGRVTLVDYDAARVFTPGAERDTKLIGTQGNAAPEQYGFAQSDIRTDVYALGVLIRALFPRDFRMLRIAARATELAPRDRYQDVSSLKAALQRKRESRREDADDEYFCTNCGAILNDQPGFSPEEGTWICTSCGQRLFGDAAGDTGDKLNGVLWYCDGCGALLNCQPGFDYYEDAWTCTECGFANDITEKNIAPDPPVK